MEGKDYVMVDGDLVEFHFNVRARALRPIASGFVREGAGGYSEWASCSGWRVASRATRTRVAVMSRIRGGSRK